MKTHHSVSPLLLLLFGLSLFFTSCVRPDLGDCPRENVRITVTTLPESTRGAFDGYRIDNVTIYVFDESDHFVTAWQGGAYTPYHSYQAGFTLDPGTYRFVAWTNQGKTYTSSHTLEEAHRERPHQTEKHLSLSYPSGGTLFDELPDLHHGMLTGQIVAEATNHDFTIVLIPNTYRLNFRVRGIPSNDSQYRFSVRDDNSHYSYTNRILSGWPEFEHRRESAFAEGELTAAMKVLKLESDRSPAFTFEDQTAGLYSYSNCLVTMIRKAYRANGQTVDFRKTFTFDIVITFEANSDVNVAVNGWSYTENNIEL